ncbi:hypothetical protein AB1K62_00235 [Parasphingorhabdus sp. JC815]|uniref:hypothetical protein n=1 Tax=Parasphingorhabdus sp. JC815 TaxID=3232140 RepID=UPI003459EE4A
MITDHPGTIRAPVRRACMKNLLSPISFALVPLALLAACSSQTPEQESAEGSTALAEPSGKSSDTPKPAPPVKKAQPDMLSLAGLGDLRIGEAVPATSGWSEMGAQLSDVCRVLSSPDYPGAYAIAEGGKVRRISIGPRSPVKLAEGIGTGASEAEVQKYYPFPATPHKYVDAPAKYLTAPNAGSGTPALRFEIGSDGKVSQIHVGTMPVLGYVEGCA